MKRYMLIETRDVAPRDFPVHNITYHDTIEDAKVKFNPSQYNTTHAGILDLKEDLWKDYWSVPEGWTDSFYQNLIDKGILIRGYDE